MENHETKPLRAIVIGATGLVGTELIKLLLEDIGFSEVLTFSRRPLLFSHPKMKSFIVDFEHFETVQDYFKGDVFFSALGTTLKKAGSKEVQYKIDYTYQYQLIQLAQKNEVAKLVLVSSLGADPKSSNFYSKMKGELERDVSDFAFDSIGVVRPSLLLGNRTDDRFLEGIGQKLFGIFSFLPFPEKYRPIKAEKVASAMVAIAKMNEKELRIFESHELQILGNG